MKRHPERFFALTALAVTALVLFGLWFLLPPGGWFWIWLAAWSVTALLFFWYDKRQARRGGWRVPEAILLGLSPVGGFAGALAGMFLFRHKTQKLLFWIVPILSALLYVWIFLT